MWRVDEKKEPQGSSLKSSMSRRARGGCGGRRLKGGRGKKRNWWHGVTAKYIRRLMIDWGKVFTIGTMFTGPPQKLRYLLYDGRPTKVSSGLGGGFIRNYFKG